MSKFLATPLTLWCAFCSLLIVLLDPSGFAFLKGVVFCFTFFNFFLSTFLLDSFLIC